MAKVAAGAQADQADARAGGRGARLHDAVDDLVQGAVAAHGDDRLAALAGRAAGEVDGVAATLGGGEVDVAKGALDGRGEARKRT